MARMFLPGPLAAAGVVFRRGWWWCCWRHGVLSSWRGLGIRRRGKSLREPQSTPGLANGSPNWDRISSRSAKRPAIRSSRRGQRRCPPWRQQPVVMTSRLRAGPSRSSGGSSPPTLPLMECPPRCPIRPTPPLSRTWPRKRRSRPNGCWRRWQRGRLVQSHNWPQRRLNFTRWEWPKRPGSGWNRSEPGLTTVSFPAADGAWRW